MGTWIATLCTLFSEFILSTIFRLEQEWTKQSLLLRPFWALVAIQTWIIHHELNLFSGSSPRWKVLYSVPPRGLYRGKLLQYVYVVKYPDLPIVKVDIGSDYSMSWMRTTGFYCTDIRNWIVPLDNVFTTSMNQRANRIHIIMLLY